VTAFPGTYAAKTDPNQEKCQNPACGGLATCSRLSKVCSVSDPPAGPHVCRDCARELRLPIHPIVCLRSAGLLSLNLRRRSSDFVPANGCLVTLLLHWQYVRSTTVQNQSQLIVAATLSRQVWGNLRFPLTVTYHGCPESSPSCLGQSLS
jgi:hypothetical protein